MSHESDPLAARSPTYAVGADPYDLGLESLPGVHPSEEAAHLARELSVHLGDRAPIVDIYLHSLSKIPAFHLRILQMGGLRIVFAPSIASALESDWAADRRGRPLTAEEILQGRSRYSRERQVAAIYDPALDIVILPTEWTSKSVDRVVAHELGHALTYHQAEPRTALLEGLPGEMVSHVLNEAYEARSQQATLRHRCLEALAEAYVYLITGREHDLPQSLLSELMFILTAVAEKDDNIRLDFRDDGEPTAIRVPEDQLIGREHPTLGWLFAPAQQAGSHLEAHEVADDEVSHRRRRRRAA